MNVYLRGFAGLTLLALTACDGALASRQARHPVDPVVDMLHRGILNLEENVEEIDERIAEVQQLPPVADPAVQELRALDLSAWHLHRQQWLVQRERLRFAVHQIERAKAHPAQRENLRADWKVQQERFLTALDDLRAQRHALERKRLAVESELLERYFK